MNFDFGEVLSHAWQITWKHKGLWVIGILFGFFVALMLLLMLPPLLFPILVENTRTDLAVIFLVGFIVVFFLFMLVLYPISVLAQTSLTLGVLDTEQEGKQSSAPELIKRSLPFFWRVLGLMLLFGLGTTLIVFGIQAIMILFTIMTLGVGSICIAPLSLLMYPALYLAIVWMEQAMNGIIIDKLTVMEAARQGWSLVRNNLLIFALMALIIYFGIGMIAGIFVVPLMIPLFIAPLGFMEHEVNWIVVSISVLCMVVSIPLFGILTGWSMIFTKSAWVLTYLRLTRSHQAQLLPQGATS
ncbi:MAG TPA: hypothetical protein VLE49_20950 [Anaerolineales bacterium]|nr:hypothetical protein [Anaerolineales bacterium]